MSLSHGVLTGNMKDPRYRAHTHYGKLGGHFATGSFSPFKYPILMMRPGATFAPDGGGPFGELLDGVHHDKLLSALRQHALHLPVYFTEVAS
jgi:CRISPR-associated protein Csm4